MIQIRITDSDGTNAVILEKATSISVTEAVSSSDEGGSFSIAKNSDKGDIANPDNGGYTKFWEGWDTETNERLNYGPITEITENGPNWQVKGSGRSALLNDFIKTTKTFYTPIDVVIDNLRYENIAVEPRTTTLVPTAAVSTDQTIVFGAITIDEKYNGLSKATKDNAIDDQINLKPGQIEPPNTYYSVDSFWSGMGTNDAHIVDLGDVYPISKISLNLPWWGGNQRFADRTYDFTLSYANDTEATLTTIQDRKFGPFHEIYNTGSNSQLMGRELYYYLGTAMSGVAFENPAFYTALDQVGPVDIRYLRTNISDVHAWFGSAFDTVSSIDGWAYQCDPTYNAGDIAGLGGDGAMKDKVINERVLEPSNNCHASIAEIGLYREILSRDEVLPLALQRIDNTNQQIIFYHVPDASETVTTPQGFRKFEPGGFFRRFQVTYSGATTVYNKFFSTDCSNCYPDSFVFGVIDDENNLIYSSDTQSQTNKALVGKTNTSTITMKGASDAVVTYADSWPATTDAFSWGGSYSHSAITNDYFIVHFKGQSFKWYATIPTTETGATVKIEIRHKDSVGAWTSYTTLEAGLALPNNISSESVYEISYESGTLLSDTVYEIKITNLDGGFCSVDSIEGYWSASLNTYNEDSMRINQYRPEDIEQIYDGRFSGGSMYKWNTNNFVNFTFEGDRVIVYSAKGRNHGKMRILMRERNNGEYYDPGPSVNVFIPGGSLTDGHLDVNLDTGRIGNEVTQFIAFDSNDYFTGGLPWGHYWIGVYLVTADLESYTANSSDSDNFVERCKDCNPAIGDPVLQNKFVYFDGISVHEKVGLSISFENQPHLEQIKSIAEAVQTEWDVTESGLRFVPRIGTDTNEVLREGQNTLVDFGITNDITKVASMLYSNGADIDGLPLFTITEDRSTKAILGRTVMRQQDFRNVADYMQLVGISRTELKKRKRPEKRITVTHTAQSLNLKKGDSYILWTKKAGSIRVRIMHKERSQSSGTEFKLECIVWPQIV